MKTLRKQIEEIFTASYSCDPRDIDYVDIMRLQKAVLKLARAIDNINNYQH
jgi:hypothetical protein